MPRAIGANCRLLTFPAATYGTAPGGNWRRMPFLSCDLGAEQPLLDADVIGVGSNRDPAAPFLDTVTVQGQAVVSVDLVNIGHWLRLLLGPPTTTGTSPNFIHTFASGVGALPSNSVEIGYPDVPSYDVCTGVRADTLEIDFSPTGAATAGFGLMGQGSVRSGTSSGGTPTAAPYTAFHKAQGSISRNGSPLAQVTGARMTYANGMEMVRTIRADRKVEGVDPGIARATGQVTVGALRGHHAAHPSAERHGGRIRAGLHHRCQPQPHLHAARGLSRAGQDPDRGAGRRGGQLRIPRRVQYHGNADDDRRAAEPAGRDGVRLTASQRVLQIRLCSGVAFLYELQSAISDNVVSEASRHDHAEDRDIPCELLSGDPASNRTK
jgi:hypothetical protein